MAPKGKTRNPQDASKRRSGKKTSPLKNADIKNGPQDAPTRPMTKFVNFCQKIGILRKEKVSSAPVQKAAECFDPDGCILSLWVEILILALAVGAVYGHTLDVPFYLDDYLSILENTSLSTWNDFRKIWQFAPLRVLGYFSFALNREWNGFNVAGYHIVNIAIHFLAGLALFALAKGILRTPALQDRKAHGYLKWFPLISALFFLVHPLQTQAVTYIVQRLASLAGLFYLSAMAFYLHGRLAELKWPFFAASFISGLCAIFTKQNTVTLPLAICLMEIILFRIQPKKLLKICIFLAAGIGVGWLLLSGISGRSPFSLESMEALTRETGQISRIEYFATQTKVIWMYIRFFIIPTGLHLDHDVKILTGFLNVQTILFLSGHILAMALAFVSIKKYPPLSFGIFFYYLAHLIESGLIPIRDVLFEHRTYLPNAGLCLAAGWFFSAFFPSLAGKRIAACAVVPVLAVFSVLTWQRNDLWRSPVELWKDNAQKAPGNFRVWDSLAQELLSAGRNQEADQALNMGLEIKNRMPGFIHWPSVISRITMLRRQGKFDEALSTADEYLQKSPNTRLQSKILASKGNIYIESKDYPKAEQSFRAALAVYPDNVPALTNLGIVLLQQGEREKARDVFVKVLEINPQQDVAIKYLESILSSRPLKPE